MNLDNPIILDIKDYKGTFIKYKIKKTPEGYITRTGAYLYRPKLEDGKFYKLENAKEIVINNLYNYPIKSSIFQLVEGGIIFYDNDKNPLPAPPQFQLPENIIRFEVVTEKGVPNEKNVPKSGIPIPFDPRTTFLKIKTSGYTSYQIKQYNNDPSIRNLFGKKNLVESRPLEAEVRYVFGKHFTVKHNNQIIKSLKINENNKLESNVILNDDIDNSILLTVKESIDFTVEPKSNEENVKSRSRSRSRSRSKSRGGTRKMKNYSARPRGII